MNPMLRATLWLGLCATLGVALVLGAFVAWLLCEVLPPGTVFTLDGERFVLPEFTRPEQWLAVAVGVLIVSLAIVIVVPPAIVLAVGLPLVAGAAGIALALAAAALVLSPLVLLLWWLCKDKDNKTGTMAP